MGYGDTLLNPQLTTFGPALSRSLIAPRQGRESVQEGGRSERAADRFRATQRGLPRLLQPSRSSRKSVTIIHNPPPFSRSMGGPVSARIANYPTRVRFSDQTHIQTLWKYAVIRLIACSF